MNKLEFSIKEEQIIKILVYIDTKQNNKVIRDKQKQIINIKYINIIDKTLASFLIFKDTNINTRQINKQTPQRWHFITSKNS